MKIKTLINTVSVDFRYVASSTLSAEVVWYKNITEQNILSLSAYAAAE